MLRHQFFIKSADLTLLPALSFGVIADIWRCGPDACGSGAGLTLGSASSSIGSHKSAVGAEPLRVLYEARALAISNFYAGLVHNPSALRWSVYSMAITGRRIRPSTWVLGRPPARAAGSSMQAYSERLAISERRRPFSGIFCGASASRGATRDMLGSSKTPLAGSTSRPFC